MIAQLAVSEVVSCRDSQARLVQRTQPCIRVVGWNTQSAIRERFLVSVQLFKVSRDRFCGRLEKLSQFRLNIKFPLRATFACRFVRGSTEKAFLRLRSSLWISTGRYLPQKLSQKWIESRYLKF